MSGYLWLVSVLAILAFVLVPVRNRMREQKIHEALIRERGLRICIAIDVERGFEQLGENIKVRLLELGVSCHVVYGDSFRYLLPKLATKSKSERGENIEAVLHLSASQFTSREVLLSDEALWSLCWYLPGDVTIKSEVGARGVPESRNERLHFEKIGYREVLRTFATIGRPLRKNTNTTAPKHATLR